MISLGILDFDSSHCVEFTRRLNHVGVTSDQFVEGARVIAGCPGKSAMAPERIARFLPDVAACGVAIVERDEVLRRTDATLVLSLCGSAHRESALVSIASRRPTFVDKPFALTFADADAIVTAAERAEVPLHYASAMRYCDELLALPGHLARWGELHGAVCYGPAKRHPSNPGLFHYGIHSVEILFTLLGAGCVSVAATHSENGEVVTGRWRDGRLGTVRGLRSGSTAYGATLFCEHGVIPIALSTTNSYRNLLQALVKGLESGTPLVSPQVILEETAFVLAALESERRGGVPVELSTILTT
jgi:predicted dehydrogenase